MGVLDVTGWNCSFTTTPTTLPCLDPTPLFGGTVLQVTAAAAHCRLVHHRPVLWMPRDVIHWLLSSANRSLSALEWCLKMTHTHSKGNHFVLSIPLCKLVLSEWIDFASWSNSNYSTLTEFLLIRTCKIHRSLYKHSHNHETNTLPHSYTNIDRHFPVSNRSRCSKCSRKWTGAQ